MGGAAGRRNVRAWGKRIGDRGRLTSIPGNYSDGADSSAKFQRRPRRNSFRLTSSRALPAPDTLETTPPARPRKKTSVVTIEFRRCRRLRVESDIDTEALGRILDVLERR